MRGRVEGREGSLAQLIGPLSFDGGSGPVGAVAAGYRTNQRIDDGQLETLVLNPTNR